MVGLVEQITGRRDAGTAAGAAEDLQGAADNALRIFISYSRADLAIAEGLTDALLRNGFDVKIDVRDLPYGEEWQAELADFIAKSDTVVWLVSPDSVKSKWCNWELGEVVRLSKRLVPVRARAVDADSLPESLGRINLLPNQGTYEPARDEAALVAALNNNRGWLKKATSLAEQARDWMAADRDGAHLMRGRALAEAETWSTSTPRDTPSPAAEILELILASRRAQQRRRKIGIGVAAAVLAGAVGLGWFGYSQQRNAVEQERVAVATAAQRRNEVARKLLESESQLGAALGNLSAAAPEEATAIGRVQASWAERLTPIREVVKSDGLRLWTIAGKQVLATGDRMMTYSDGSVVGFAPASDNDYVLVDSLGRILHLDRNGKIVRSLQWNGLVAPGTYGEPFPGYGVASNELALGGLSRLELFKVGDSTILAVGTRAATYAGGEDMVAFYLDLKNGIFLPGGGGAGQAYTRQGNGNPDCSAGFDLGPLGEFGKAYADRGIAPPFKLVNPFDFTSPVMCLQGRYLDSGELAAVEASEESFDFISPTGQFLALPVLKPELDLWEPVEEAKLQRTRMGGSFSEIQPLGDGYAMDFLPAETFNENAMFRGGDNAGFFYTRTHLEAVRSGSDPMTLPPELKTYERNGRNIVVSLHSDKWLKPEVCWFDAAFVVESCESLGEIYDAGGGMFLSRSGAYVVVVGMNTMADSVTLIDIDAKVRRVPLQRSNDTVIEAFTDAAEERLFAIDERGVVWTYSLPSMELISTFDLNWRDGTEEGALRIGRSYVDLSSRGVVRLLDIETQLPDWIAAPFATGAEIEGASLSSDGAVVLAKAASGEVRVLDGRTGMPLTSVFKPDGPCGYIEHETSSDTLELTCASVLRRTPRPVQAVGGDLSAYALDSQTAAERFFATVEEFDLGAYASKSLDVAVPEIKGTVEEFIDTSNAEPEPAAQSAIAVADPPAIVALSWPVSGPVISKFEEGPKDHRDGIGIGAAEGTAVTAAADGVVIYAGDGLKVFGNTVLVRHEAGVVTVYGHLSRMLVERGQTVARGEQLGHSGMTGDADVPKLHFEVRQDSQPVDPAGYLE